MSDLTTPLCSVETLAVSYVGFMLDSYSLVAIKATSNVAHMVLLAN